MQVRVVRIFNTYGPNMALDDGRVVSNFVAQALTGQPLTIFGDGLQTRSFQYVSDLIEGKPCPPAHALLMPSMLTHLDLAIYEVHERHLGFLAIIHTLIIQVYPEQTRPAVYEWQKA